MAVEELSARKARAGAREEALTKCEGALHSGQDRLAADRAALEQARAALTLEQATVQAAGLVRAQPCFYNTSTSSTLTGVPSEQV